jgi:hypothetical protein
MTQPEATRFDLTGVVDAYRRLLDGHTPHVVGAFLYGSVVTATTSATSDVDCFVLVSEPQAAGVRAELRHDAAELQRALGYSPDPLYPIEVFTPATCRLAIDDPRTRHWCARAARTGALPSEAQDSDGVEILHALLAPSRILCGQPVVAELADTARHLLTGCAAGAHPPGTASALARLARALRIPAESLAVTTRGGRQ